MDSYAHSFICHITCVCVTHSLCYTPEPNTKLYINYYTPIIFFKACSDTLEEANIKRGFGAKVVRSISMQKLGEVFSAQIMQGFIAHVNYLETI